MTDLEILQVSIQLISPASGNKVANELAATTIEFPFN